MHINLSSLKRLIAYLYELLCMHTLVHKAHLRAHTHAAKQRNTHKPQK